MSSKQKKTLFLLFTFFFFIFLLSSGEGTPWIEMIIGSGLYSIVMTPIAFLFIQLIHLVNSAIGYLKSHQK